MIVDPKKLKISVSMDIEEKPARELMLKHMSDREKNPIVVDRDLNVIEGWDYVVASIRLCYPNIKVQVRENNVADSLSSTHTP